jgi:hypothetical protein
VYAESRRGLDQFEDRLSASTWPASAADPWVRVEAVKYEMPALELEGFYAYLRFCQRGSQSSSARGAIMESRREKITRDIKRAQQEFQAGHCQPVTPKELSEEILGEQYCIDSAIPL